MAAPDIQLRMVTLTINDIEVEVPKGELIVEAVKRLGLEIPIFCYHPRMKPVGMCRMCFVDVGFEQPDGSVKMMPKPQTGCTLPADDNMVVYTDTERVRADRKSVLEFLLINHPLDCPICDRGGECPLQNNTLFYGPATTRYVELKRHLPKAFPLSKYVTLDLERCIQCGRCVRFTEEISGDAQLAFFFRGAQMQPRTYQFTDFESRFSGNTIEICPVGALTSSVYRFRARPWDLQTKPAICMECSNGCNTWFDYRVDQLARINGRTNEAVNEEWTCDKGKFGQGYLNSRDRLTRVLVRESERLVASDWATAFRRIVEAFDGTRGSSAALASGMAANEDLYLLKRLFVSGFDSYNIDHRWTRNIPQHDVYETHGIAEVNTPIADFECEPVIFLFGNNLTEEQPILYLRIRKAWFRHDAKVIVASHAQTEADNFAYASLRYKPGAELAFLGGLHRAITGSGGVEVEEAASIAGVGVEAIRRAAGAMKDSFALVSSRSLYELSDGEQIVNALANLCVVANSASRFNLFATSANEQGAREVGFFPASGAMNTRQILEACVAGKVKALWLMNCDPIEQYFDKDLARSALEAVEFVVVQSFMRTQATEFASVALPACAFSERDGSYTNLERRVQRVRPILAPKGDSKPAWKVFSEILLRLKGTTPPFHAHEVMEMIAVDHPAFATAKYEALEAEGALLAQAATANPRTVDIDYQSRGVTRT